MFQPTNRPPRHPLLLFGGMLVFGLGVVGGLVFVAMVGTDSPEFREYFVYFIGAYFLGTTLVLLGK